MDWISDVFSSDLLIYAPVEYTRSVCSCILFDYFWSTFRGGCNGIRCRQFSLCEIQYQSRPQSRGHACRSGDPPWLCHRSRGGKRRRSHVRSEEHTSELQSLMRISYAVFCLKTKTNKNNKTQIIPCKDQE